MRQNTKDMLYVLKRVKFHQFKTVKIFKFIFSIFKLKKIQIHFENLKHLHYQSMRSLLNQTNIIIPYLIYFVFRMLRVIYLVIQGNTYMYLSQFSWQSCICFFSFLFSPFLLLNLYLTYIQYQ